METKISKKFRLLALLPYGICSRPALYLCTKIPEISLVPYAPDMDMKERERLLQQASTAITRTVERMLETGYIEEKVKKYGPTVEDQLRLVSLTKAGLYLLASNPDQATEDARIDQLGNISYSKLNGLTYRSVSEYDVLLREMVYLDQKGIIIDDDIDAMEEAFHKALEDGEMTILACDSLMADSVEVSNPRYNAKRLYRAWRLANINALFMANEFLTYLDRRPIDTGWAIGSIQDNDSFQKYISSGEMDVPAFMYHALNKWYNAHPESYRFLEPLPEADMATSEEYDSWRSTPAFYATTEIPGFAPLCEKEIELSKGQKNNMVHTLAGIAVGKKIVYIVHHTRPTKTPWGERWEMTAIEIVQNALEEAGILSPSGEPYKIREALVVCGSVYQFEAFFTAAKNKISKRWSREKRVGVPYSSVCLIPINGSGAMQLRYLMNCTPIEMDYILTRTILQKDSRFSLNNDPLFPLTFDGVPVLVAHSMQLQKLYDALLEYQDGMDFYISCYPGQVKYIRRIMPEAKFL